MTFWLRFLSSVPLLWFVYKGHTWAIVLMFILSMFTVEIVALICNRLIQRHKMLHTDMKRLEKKTESVHRVNTVLSDVFDKKP